MDRKHPLPSNSHKKYNNSIINYTYRKTTSYDTTDTEITGTKVHVFHFFFLSILSMRLHLKDMVRVPKLIEIKIELTQRRNKNSTVLNLRTKCHSIVKITARHFLIYKSQTFSVICRQKATKRTCQSYIRIHSGCHVIMFKFIE